MHKGKRKVKGSGAVGKAIVMGLLERHAEKGKSKVRTRVVADTKKTTLEPIVRQHVEPGANVHTDSLISYRGLSPDFVHAFVDHAETYVKGNVHTSGSVSASGQSPFTRSSCSDSATTFATVAGSPHGDSTLSFQSRPMTPISRGECIRYVSAKYIA
jgi:hypothetical protein